MTNITALRTTIGVLALIVIGLLGWTSWNYYSDWNNEKTQSAVNDARAQGQVQMLNTIYREAGLRGEITLASILSVDVDEDGRPDRGDAIRLIIAAPEDPDTGPLVTADPPEPSP